MKQLMFLSVILLASGCSTLESTIQAGKDIAGAVVDDVVDVTKTAISIPVGAVGTVVDKLEEQTTDQEPDADKDK
tara:strand:- start:588 stop:812 length:225 start_codon:yes stop_codon:yes gene_type:complete